VSIAAFLDSLDRLDVGLLIGIAVLVGVLIGLTLSAPRRVAARRPDDAIARILAAVSPKGPIMTLLERLNAAMALANAETNKIAGELADLKAQLAAAAAAGGLSSTDAGVIADQLDALSTRLQTVAGDTPTETGTTPTPEPPPA
jgi:hypothetical protein